MAQIRLERLRKQFGDVEAVKGLDLKVPDGSFAALLGPSGCGKTTTLRMIAGLETPTAGAIYFDERRMNAVPPGERDVGFVFQNYAIFTHMSVYDNVAFGLKVRNVPPAQIRRAVEEVAALLELTPVLQHEIEQTLVYVTHDQVEAMSMADYIAVMDFGVLQQFGTPDEIYNRPVNTVVANFIGSPHMNFIDCTYRRNGERGSLIHETGSLRVPVDARRRHLLERRSTDVDLILGIRPEHLHLHPEPVREGVWPGTVYVTEPLGAKTVVHVKVDATVIRVTAPADYQPKVGERQWIELNRDYLHIFDANSGEAIR